LETPSLPRIDLDDLQSRGVNWPAVIFWGVVIGAVSCGLILYFKVEPFFGWLNEAVAWADVQIRNLGLNDTAANLMESAKDPATMLALAVPVGTTLYGLYERSKEKKATAQALLDQKLREQSDQIVGQVNQKLEVLTLENNQLSKTIDELKQSELPRLYEMKKAELEAATKTIASKQEEINAITTMHTNFIENITSNTQTVTDPITKEVFRIIEKTKVM